MQLMYSSVITQSRLKTSLVPFFFLTHLLIFDAFSPPSGSAEDTEQPAPQDSVQTFNAYPDSKHFYIFIYALYLYIEHDFLKVMAVLSHTRTHILS